MHQDILFPEGYYHVYNRANGRENLFTEDDNYFYFLQKYKQHVAPIADTLAYALMPNHFHFVVRVRSTKELTSALSGFETLTELDQSKKLSRQFSHLFNSYAQAFNKKYGRHGSLFQRPYKRNQITSETHLKRAIIYVHRNPVHHGFTDRIKDWSYTSYESHMSKQPTQLSRELVMKLFGSETLFKEAHENAQMDWLEQLAEHFEQD